MKLHPGDDYYPAVTLVEV